MPALFIRKFLLFIFLALILFPGEYAFYKDLLKLAEFQLLLFYLYQYTLHLIPMSNKTSNVIAWLLIIIFIVPATWITTRPLTPAAYTLLITLRQINIEKGHA